MKEKKIYVKVPLFVSINASPSYLSKFEKNFPINIAAITNISQDHLDYHKNLKDYLIDGGTFILSDANSTNSSNYNLLGIEKYLEILDEVGYSKITGEGWGGKNFQIFGKMTNISQAELLLAKVKCTIFYTMTTLPLE